MEFRVADTFTASLARLTAQELKAVETTAFDLQMGASAPGLSFHKLDRAQDPNFWSVRVNDGIRVIVHRTGASLNSDMSYPFPKPASGRIAVKVINHLGDEVMKVFAV